MPYALTAADYTQSSVLWTSFEFVTLQVAVEFPAELVGSPQFIKKSLFKVQYTANRLGVGMSAIPWTRIRRRSTGANGSQNSIPLLSIISGPAG